MKAIQYMENDRKNKHTLNIKAYENKIDAQKYLNNRLREYEKEGMYVNGAWVGNRKTGEILELHIEKIFLYF